MVEVCIAAVVMARADNGIIGQGEELPGYGIELGAGVSAREVGASRTADEQGVAGEDVPFDQQAHAVGRVSGSVEDGNHQVADRNLVAVVKMNVDGRTRRPFLHGEPRPD